MTPEPLEVVWKETADPLAHAVQAGRVLCGAPGKITPDGGTGCSARCPECVQAVEGMLVSSEEMITVGVTYRQLDHWTNQGLLRASNPDCGSGTKRMWPVSEAQIARVMAILTDPVNGPGMSPRKAAEAARNGGIVGDGVKVIVERRDVRLP